MKTVSVPPPPFFYYRLPIPRICLMPCIQWANTTESRKRNDKRVSVYPTWTSQSKQKTLWMIECYEIYSYNNKRQCHLLLLLFPLPLVSKFKYRLWTFFAFELASWSIIWQKSKKCSVIMINNNDDIISGMTERHPALTIVSFYIICINTHIDIYSTYTCVFMCTCMYVHMIKVFFFLFCLFI